MNVREFIDRPALLVKRQRLFTRPSERSIFLRRCDSGPAHFKRHVEPHAQATVLVNKLTISFLNPCATAECDHACCPNLEYVTQRISLENAKRAFTVCNDQLRW